MTLVEVNGKLCKGCAYCIKFCPKQILEMGTVRGPKGYFIPAVTDQEKCIACQMCSTVCPEGAIEVSKGDE